MRLKAANDETAELAALRREIAAKKRELESLLRQIEDAKATRDIIAMETEGLREKD